MKLNNGAASLQLPLDYEADDRGTKKHHVLPHSGRFLVIKDFDIVRRVYTVVDDCRTEKFAKMRADALNSGAVKA